MNTGKMSQEAIQKRQDRVAARRLANRIYPREQKRAENGIIAYDTVVKEIVDACGCSQEDAEWAWSSVLRQRRTVQVSKEVKCPVCGKALILCNCV